jgi:hypothetical protein
MPVVGFWGLCAAERVEYSIFCIVHQGFAPSFSYLIALSPLSIDVNGQ